MTRRPRLDDRTADALFSGRLPADREDLADVAALAESLRAAASAAPTPVPNAALDAVLQDGLSTDNGDLPVTVGSNAAAPATQAARLPNWRRKKMLLEMIIAKVAGISLLAKTGVAAAAITAGATGVGVTGNLPTPAQDAFDRAFDEAPADDETEATDEATDESTETGADDPVETEETVEVLEVEETEETEETEEGDEGDEDGRPESPGAEGRATADENAGENGAEGRRIADEAATNGREFGQQRADEAKERPEDAPEDGQDASDEERQTGEDAAADGRERADNASGNGEGSDTEQDEASDESSTKGQPEETPAGSAETGEQKSSAAHGNAPAGRP